MKFIKIIFVIIAITTITIGIKRSFFIETGNISISAVQKRCTYILPDYKGLSYPHLKTRIYNTIKPSVVAMGSSRVLQFREQFFKKPFYNLGYTIGSIPDIKNVLTLINRDYVPDVLIFGIDFWWFSKEYTPTPHIKDKISPVKKALKYIFKPYVLYAKGQCDFNDFLNSFSSPLASDHDGTIHDGSFIYYNIVTSNTSSDAHFFSTKKRINSQSSPFFTSKELSQEHVQEFISLVNDIKKLAKNVFFIIPPLSQEIYNDLKTHSQQYPHLFMLEEALTNEGVHVINYTDPSSIESFDCEMIDGFHGGEITYARILLDLAQKNEILLNFINEEYLKNSIHNFRGSAMIPNQNYVHKPELDFLEMGCKKNNSQFR